MSKEYLSNIRRHSHYPTFRGFVVFATLMGYLIALIILATGIISGQGIGVAAGIVGAIVIALISRAIEEFSLMVADIADATLEHAERKSLETREDVVPAKTRKSENITPVSNVRASTLNAKGPQSAHTNPMPKGRCPNCRTVISLQSKECPKCRATFGAGASWEIMPIE